MTPTFFTEPPLVLPATLGPYRRSDYEALPDEPRCELIYGRIYVTPSPLVLHQVLVLLLAEHLGKLAARRGGLVLVAPLDVHFADHSVVQPDVIYLSPERRHLAQSWVEGAPDLLVEVLSPGTARRDRGEKLRLYAESGVAEYWIVDPVERQIELLVNSDGDMTVVLPVGGVYESPAVAGVELAIEAFWAEVDRRLGA